MDVKRAYEFFLYKSMMIMNYLHQV